MIGSINSLKNINEIIKKEKQKSSVVKKLFDDEEVEQEDFGDIGGIYPHDKELSHVDSHEEHKSSEDK